MTLKTSLFNSGIFKNTIRRFKWGSFLYFIALFFSVPFIFMVQSTQRLERRFENYAVGKALLTDEYLIFPILLAIVVPTIVGVLAYRFVHSHKQAIAVHALPVKRKENYISTLLASFVLMFIPVLTNGLILLFMSLTGYGKIFVPWCVVYWFFVNVSIIFIMFSVASFTAFLSGHPAAHIIINIFVHSLPALFALAVFLVSDVFLYGFVQTDSFIANKIIENTPVVWFFSKTIRLEEELDFFKTPQFWSYTVLSVVFYILGYLLYKKRKIETSGDVAAFKIFRPILKYSIITSVAVVMFGISNGMELGVIPTVIIIAATTLVGYFAIEMLMNKTFKVFKLYKGYLGFAGAMVVVTLFFAYTSVFGYETRIPESPKIIKAGVYNLYHNLDDLPIVSDEKVILDVREIHEELTKNIPVIENKSDENKRQMYLEVAYQLENGKLLKRRYLVDESVGDKHLSKMYESEKYKRNITGIDNINIDNVTNLTVRVDLNNYSYQLMLNEDSKGFLKAVDKDMEALTYEEMEKKIYDIDIRTQLSLTVAENKIARVFKKVPYSHLENEAYMTMSFSLGINSNYKNAFNFLKEKGYYTKMTENISENIYIYSHPFDVKEQKYTIKGDVGVESEFYVNPKDLIKIEEDDAIRASESLFYKEREEKKESKYYAVFCHTNNSDENIWFSSNVTSFKVDEVPEYLLKYIQK